MSPTKTKKMFDCVEFKRKVQAEIYDETKNMTAQEEIAYFNRTAQQGSLGSRWKKIKAATKARKNAK